MTTYSLSTCSTLLDTFPQHKTKPRQLGVVLIVVAEGMNYLKSLKDGKRRAVENVLEATGKSEKTIDENYEVDYEQYSELVQLINNSKSAIKNLLLSQKQYYENIQKHAGFLHDLHEQNNNPSHPSSSTTVIFLLLGEQCQSYLSSMKLLNQKHR
jgi:hypothetical protein